MAEAAAETISETGTGYQEYQGYQLIPASKIKVDPVTDVRMGPKYETESKDIKALAQSFKEQGQLQTILVRPNGKDGDYLIVAGRRRLQAGKLIPGFAMKAEVREMSDEEAYRAALTENIKRRNFSPLDLARNIQVLRKQNNWTGEKGTTKVAEFLGVSNAQVSQHELLLTEKLPESVLEKVHNFEWAFSTVQTLFGVKPEKRAAVVEEAKKEAKQEAQAKADAKAGKGKKAAPVKDSNVKVEKRHVVKAARKQEALTGDKPRTRAELLEPFTEILESVDGYSAEVTAFVKYYLNTYAVGKGTVAGVRNKLNEVDFAISDCAEKLKAQKAKTRAAKTGE